MVDRQVRLSRPRSEPPASFPAASVAWVEHQSPFDYLDGGVYILAKIGEQFSRVDENTGILAGAPKLGGDVSGDECGLSAFV
jgi:hypothetical protein